MSVARTPSGRPRIRYSTPTLLVASIVLLALGILVAVFPTLSYVRGLVMGGLHPLAEFDANEEIEFSEEDPYTRYYLVIQINHHTDELPDMHVNIDAQDGEEIMTEPVNSWHSIFGRSYRRFLLIDPPSSGEFTISVDAPATEDFLIYRSIEDVSSHEARRSMPLWIAASVPALAGLGLLGVVVIRVMSSGSRLDLGLD